ncbi:MAG: hypothetical protein ACE5HJ_04760 [Thermoplasmata archaeon]
MTEDDGGEGLLQLVGELPPLPQKFKADGKETSLLLLQVNPKTPVGTG